MSTAIEWTQETWNPLAGCTPVSEGCRNCYAAKEAVRLAGNPNEKIAAKYAGTAEMRGAGTRRRAVFTGRVNLDESALTKPLRWRMPRRVFVNSMSDLFHEAVPEDYVAAVVAVMAACPQHTFQVLTKRPERMAAFFSRWAMGSCWMEARDRGVPLVLDDFGALFWPLPNVWLGTSVEDQRAADERIPHLLATPAAVRFLSCEPLLGPVEFSDVTGRSDCVAALGKPALDGIHWVIAGGESGPGARPMHPDWARSLRDQCQAAGVPFFFKQWGEYLAVTGGSREERHEREVELQLAGVGSHLWADQAMAYRVGKKAAGRKLDGRTWDEFPEVAR